MFDVQHDHPNSSSSADMTNDFPEIDFNFDFADALRLSNSPFDNPQHSSSSPCNHYSRRAHNNSSLSLVAASSSTAVPLPAAVRREDQRQYAQGSQRTSGIAVGRSGAGPGPGESSTTGIAGNSSPATHNHNNTTMARSGPVDSSNVEPGSVDSVGAVTRPLFAVLPLLPPSPPPPSASYSPSPSSASPAYPPPPAPKVSFEDFALRYRQSQRKLAQRKKLETHLYATKVSIGISVRLIRVGAAVQRGLVECLKYDDKSNFVAIYQALHDVQESSDCVFRRHCLHHRLDPLDDWPPQHLQKQQQHSSSPPDSGRSPGFFHQLSPQSRSDLLDILQLARTDSQFLFTWLRSLSQLQVAALISSTPFLDAGDPVFPSSASRSRNQFSFLKRNASHSAPFKDYAIGLERADPLSALLFNVYAAPLDSHAPEARLRLDVWSSVCAKLFSHGGNRHFPLIGHILSSWAVCSHWRARPKFELYLMDTLQAGAFLLESIDTPSGLSFDAEAPDPLRTDVAEEFFTSAVDSLFSLLDDPDAGLPHAVMEFACAVLRKLDHPGIRDRFLEFLLIQWFCSKFLYTALTYPETHGLLLDFHIGKNAREKLMGQVGFQAYTQVLAVLHSMSDFSVARPVVRQHVENMLLRLHSTCDTGQVFSNDNSPVEPDVQRDCSVFLMLSSTDVLTILNTLFPKTSSFLYNSPTASARAMSPSSFNPVQFHNERTASGSKPGFPHQTADESFRRTVGTETDFPTEMNFFSLPVDSLFRNADRIRFELLAMADFDDRSSPDHPSTEDWAVFPISEDGESFTEGLLPNSETGLQDSQFVADAQSISLGVENNYEALQTAIIKLAEEDNVNVRFGCVLPCQDTDLLKHHSSLRQSFDRALSNCHQGSDFIGAHYWWNASRQLLRSTDNFPSRSFDDSWILRPMHASCTRSLDTSRSIIERCENESVILSQNMHGLQTTARDTMATVAKLRNKMWYMTDVKNSKRYEEARSVALALKTMVHSARLFRQSQNEPRMRSSTKSLAGSFLQMPELQVINLIKAASSQGGPNKLSDEQVDLTRKWLSQNGIDNFCRGEERIHRFCYEVKTSINRLVGETMAEAPVLWACELFQQERSKYEGYNNRRIVSMSSPGSSMRPPSLSSEEAVAQIYGTAPRRSGSIPRSPLDNLPLGRQKSFQSFTSDKWKHSRDPSATDLSSIGDSPGRDTTSTAESCSTFWSSPLAQPQYATSASSLYSRPASLFSETLAPPRRNDRNAQKKAVFLHETRQALTSLLLSDLGSPVWSCGSETDAWFINVLNRKNIQAQMEKSARVQRFEAEYEERSARRASRRTSMDRRRSVSVGHVPLANKSAKDAPLSSWRTRLRADDRLPFSYRAAFGRLLEIFSRHANPFLKLNALRDLRSLVVAALNDLSADNMSFINDSTKPTCERVRGARSARHSVSGSCTDDHEDRRGSQPTASPVVESMVYGSHPSDFSAPDEKQIVDFLRELILDIKPKTLFRDLQFISAFVPGEILNNTDSGTAFLQLGLAALSLKDEVCNSMVEIADKIVSQELSRRHPHGPSPSTRTGQGIEDAAGMWIVTAKEGNPVAQRELAILYLTHPDLLPRVTLPLTLPRDAFKVDMMYHRDKDTKSDPQSMCLALHWMQLSAHGGDELAKNWLREREGFDSIA